jgi:hypothetical protein
MDCWQQFEPRCLAADARRFEYRRSWGSVVWGGSSERVVNSPGSNSLIKRLQRFAFDGVSGGEFGFEFASPEF